MLTLLLKQESIKRKAGNAGTPVKMEIHSLIFFDEALKPLGRLASENFFSFSITNGGVFVQGGPTFGRVSDTVGLNEGSSHVHDFKTLLAI